MTATNLAFLFRPAQIALLGIDLYSNEHFYTGREAQYNNGLIDGIAMYRFPKRAAYPVAAPRFPIWQALARQMADAGVKVWNCSPKSALGCFEKIDIGELIRRNKSNQKHAYPEWEKKLAFWQGRAGK